MLSPELLKKIERITITSRALATDIFSGEYETAFRGRGMEFEEVREYIPGDDIRTIDWNVTARMDHPYVKVYREEREQTVMFLVDASASENFGSKERLKKDVTAEIAAILAYAAIKSNDKIGLIIFTDKVERYIPPKKGRGHVWHVISEILSFKPEGQKTNIGEALNFLMRVLHRRAVCFILSDFLTGGFEKAMRIARFKHDVIALMIMDALEGKITRGGIMIFRDLETGSLIERDLGSKTLQRAYEIEQNKEMQRKKSSFQSMNIDFLFLQTDQDPVPPLLQFFRMREKKL